MGAPFRGRASSRLAAPLEFVGVSTPEDQVSPELALVDSGLREQQPAAGPAGSLDAAPRARRSRRRRRSRLGVVLVLLVAILVAGVAAAVLIRHANTSTSAAPVPRDFAWAPVAGARAYDVEIRRGESIVYSTRTTAPHVRVPARWTRGGQTFSLTPGTYQWYVWPLERSGTGVRRGPAVVATTFAVGRH